MCVSRAVRDILVRNCPFLFPFQLHTDTSRELRVPGGGFPKAEKSSQGLLPSSKVPPSRVPGHRGCAPLIILNKPHGWGQNSEGKRPSGKSEFLPGRPVEPADELFAWDWPGLPNKGQSQLGNPSAGSKTCLPAVFTPEHSDLFPSW